MATSFSQAVVFLTAMVAAVACQSQSLGPSANVHTAAPAASTNDKGMTVAPVSPKAGTPRLDRWTEKGGRGAYCTANAEVRADGCDVSVCKKTIGLFGGARIADSIHNLNCREAQTICGREYTCECQTCAAEPDYATRMQRDRHFSFTDHGEVVLATVKYQGGVCEAMGSTHYGEGGQCSISADDTAKIGGCLRRQSVAWLVMCGESKEVCDGLIVTCECPDGGMRRGSVRDTR